MSSSPLKWVMPALYLVTLNSSHPEAALHGFRGEERSQERYFGTQREIDDFEAELWLYGFKDVTIEEVSDE